MNIMDFIPTGKENRISFRELKVRSGISDDAAVRKEIRKARDRYEPICNDGNGYYIAEKPEDMMHSIRRMGSRISKNIATKKNMEKAMMKMKAEGM